MVTERIIRIISDLTKTEFSELNENSSMDDVGGWDSVTYVDIILELEEEFNVEFTALESVSLDRVRSIIETINMKLN
jgi:acyl carrier protein